MERGQFTNMGEGILTKKGHWAVVSFSCTSGFQLLSSPTLVSGNAGGQLRVRLLGEIGGLWWTSRPPLSESYERYSPKLHSSYQ